MSYLEAIDCATDSQLLLKARAALFLAIEEVRLKTDQSQTALFRALTLAKETADPIAILLLTRPTGSEILRNPSKGLENLSTLPSLNSAAATNASAP
jgi:hypothetical protein